MIHITKGKVKGTQDDAKNLIQIFILLPDWLQLELKY